MKKLLLATTALIALAMPVKAADLPVKAPPVVAVAVFSWTGCYLGINGGWHHSRSRATVAPEGAASEANLGAGFAAGAFPRDHESRGGGGTIGGTAGCNYQSGNWLVGLETDFNWSGSDGRQQQDITAPGFVATRSIYEHDVDWFGTFRGRAGVLLQQRVLAYVTGGLAYARVRTAYQQQQLVGAAFLPFSSGEVTDTRLGWTVGGGLEFALTNQWSIKGEYLYARLHGESFISNTVLPTCLAAGACQIRVSNQDSDHHIARLGLNYRFGGPVVARY